MSPLILIVEDEAPQAEALRYNLDKEGFETAVAATGVEALEMVEQKQPDLAIIDWMLPEYSGVEICRRLRKGPETKNLPIIMLTARGEESDKVLGLDSGADDYVVKPYSPREIVARVRALLRRSNSETSAETLEYAGVVMDLDTHKVMRGDGPIDSIRPIHLGPTEFRLLKVLMERPGKVFSRESLLNRVWDRDIHVEDRTIDAHIRRLRKALNADGDHDIIRTVRGSGYAIDDQQ